MSSKIVKNCYTGLIVAENKSFQQKTLLGDRDPEGKPEISEIPIFDRGLLPFSDFVKLETLTLEQRELLGAFKEPSAQVWSTFEYENLEDAKKQADVVVFISIRPGFYAYTMEYVWREFYPTICPRLS